MTKDTEQPCGNPKCKTLHTPGKGGAARGYCARCYKYLQRNGRLPDKFHERPTGESVTQGIVFEPRRLALVRDLAGPRGLSQWVQDAITQKLKREGHHA